MSHVVQIQTEIRDPIAIRAACDRLFGEVKLFSSTATGWQVRFSEWRYPVVCDATTAKIPAVQVGDVPYSRQVELAISEANKRACHSFVYLLK